jgi:hypothetical protein
VVVLNPFQHDGSALDHQRVDVNLRASEVHRDLGLKLGPDGVDTSVHSSRTVDEYGIVAEETD